MVRTRNKIKYCLDDYLAHLSSRERSDYLLNNTSLIAVIHSGVTDEEIMSEAKRYDEENDADLFSEVIKFRVYCIACHKIDCDC